MTHPLVDADKADWRRWARAVRRDIDWAGISNAVVDLLSDSDRLAVGATVLSYLPMGDEVDLSKLHRRRKDVTWLVTRTPRRGGLTVHRLDSALETHRYGFLQPIRGSRAFAPQLIDIALVPGFVFDTEMHRLGRGGGYYDRLLASLRDDALSIGVGASRLVVRCGIPTDSHDVRVDTIVTENGFI